MVEEALVISRSVCAHYARLMADKYVLGIDIGGSGIKGAPVDLERGDFAAERLRISTPQPATPNAVAKVVKQIADHFADITDPADPIGITFPAPVLHGVIPFIANLDKSWAGVNAEELFTKACGRRVCVVNDADAAGVAEVHYGAAKDQPGVVIVTTLGTGIGSALLYRGVLVPNTELGHLELNGHDAESRAAASVKDKKHLSYKEWADERLQPYYAHLEKLFAPDLIVVGGGVSKDSAKFLPRLKLRARIVPAELLNRAGIVGAAWLARNGASTWPTPIQGAGKSAEIQK